MTKQFNIIEQPHDRSSKTIVRGVIRSYRNPVIRTYAVARFLIVPIRFLYEFSQYIPNHGCVLDLGCGFGLFTLFFAQTRPEVAFTGVDRSPKRIKVAMSSAERLGLKNVEFICQDVREYKPKTSCFNAIFTLDLLHHLPISDGNEIIRRVSCEWLQPGGVFMIKDVTTRPRAMLIFTFLLDLLMCPSGSFFYRSDESWVRELEMAGLIDVRRHYLWDILPYPHILLVSSKPGITVI